MSIADIASARVIKKEMNAERMGWINIETTRDKPIRTSE